MDVHRDSREVAIADDGRGEICGANSARVESLQIRTRSSRCLGERRRVAESDTDLLERVRAAKAVNMDETGWRTQGERCALWAALRVSVDCVWGRGDWVHVYSGSRSPKWIVSAASAAVQVLTDLHFVSDLSIAR